MPPRREKRSVSSRRRGGPRKPISASSSGDVPCPSSLKADRLAQLVWPRRDECTPRTKHRTFARDNFDECQSAERSQSRSRTPQHTEESGWGASWESSWLTRGSADPREEERVLEKESRQTAVENAGLPACSPSPRPSSESRRRWGTGRPPKQAVCAGRQGITQNVDPDAIG